MTCPLALKLSEFEAVVVQPAAKCLLGSPVTTIHHYGTYACRQAPTDPRAIRGRTGGKTRPGFAHHAAGIRRKATQVNPLERNRL